MAIFRIEVIRFIPYHKKEKCTKLLAFFLFSFILKRMKSLEKIHTPKEGTLALEKQLIFFLESSIGKTFWQRWYIHYEKEESIRDVVGGGNLSCAFFVSSLLTLLSLLKKPQVHTFVSTLIESIEESGWEKTHTPLPLSIVYWGEKKGESGKMHQHIGFILNEKTAVSMQSTTGTPQKHTVDYDGSRPPLFFYTHPLLHTF
jgi:hypothetical protein